MKTSKGRSNGKSCVMALTLFATLGAGHQALSRETEPDSAHPEDQADMIQAGAGILDQGPEGNTFEEVQEVRREVASGEKTDSLLSSKFEPLHKLWDPFVRVLGKKGLDIIINYTVMVQNSGDLIPGIENTLPGAQDTLSGGDADLAIKWHALKAEEPWAGYFRLSSEYRHGYNELPPVAMGKQTGSLWLTMRGWTEYSHVALTEAYWHQGTLESPFEYRVGRVKNTTIWNGGKYVGGNTGIVGGQFTGTPALATFFSAWSMTGVYHPVGGNTHIVAGVFQANASNETFEPILFDELTYALQMGCKPEFLGNKGRYHIFVWHDDETESKTDANGFAINAEHQFGNWTPFLRYSFGDQDREDPKSHSIRQSANVGIGYDGIFGQTKDWVALVGTWAEPTDKTLRDQYGLEFDYSFRLTPHSTLTPHIQLIRDPSLDPSKDSIVLVGLRAKIDF